MSVIIRARFEGKVLVPEGPIDLPINEPLDFEYKPPEPRLSPKEIAKRRAALKRFAARAVKGANISVEALRRENMEGLDRGL